MKINSITRTFVISALSSAPGLHAFSALGSSSKRATLVPSTFQLGSTVESIAEGEISAADAPTRMAESRINKSEDNRSPAEVENEKFDCDPTVEFWRNFQIDGLESAQENAQNLASVISNFASSRDGLNYWLRHTGRTGYFISNALLGNFGFSLHEALVKRDNSGSPFDPLMREPAIVSRILLECALAYEQDFQRIEEGQYKKPYDMYENSRQSSPLFAGQQTARFVREAIGTLARRKKGSEDAKRTWLSDDTNEFYPEYYRTAFHYQTDGWMSQESADVYEVSTETLFLGRQDAMQRTALSPIVSHSKDLEYTGKPLKVLEIACGTGRFMTFIRDNLPLDTDVTAVDLSPFYLNAARDNDANWRRIRSKGERNNNSINVNLKPARFVQAKAEELPFEDGEFDAVVCVYLFHELPREIRSKVATEMARVAKPGARVVLTDSTQLGDRPIFDDSMKNFEKMNEPYYVDYTQDNLPAHFENAGLKCLTKTVCTSTKTLAFRKPETA